MVSIDIRLVDMVPHTSTNEQLFSILGGHLLGQFWAENIGAFPKEFFFLLTHL